MKRYMCFDIGGTSVKFGVAGESGALLHKGEIPNVITQKGVDGLVESLASVMEQYQQEYRLYGIAVSTAGVVDPEKGLILYAPRVRHWENGWKNVAVCPVRWRTM